MTKAKAKTKRVLWVIEIGEKVKGRWEWEPRSSGDVFYTKSRALVTMCGLRGLSFPEYHYRVAPYYGGPAR